MARTVKVTKQGLKEANSLVDSLKELVWMDLKNHYNGFEEMIHSRVKESEDTILDATKAKLAIVAGISVMRKDFERAHRKFSRSNDVEELRTFLRDMAGRIQRLREANNRIVDSLHTVLNLNLTAVEVVEKFASDLQRSAGTWERNGREIDESILELCDENEPTDLAELEEFIVKQGYAPLLEESSHSSSDEDA
jgi:hypothetical protein